MEEQDKKSEFSSSTNLVEDTFFRKNITKLIIPSFVYYLLSLQFDFFPGFPKKVCQTLIQNFGRR
jgi:hypothetical protein